MEHITELIGQTFGLLTVVERVKGEKYLCHCECGKEKIVNGCHLKSGRVKSCGCARFKHGMKEDRLYQIWHGMKDRCLRKNGQHYQKYGGRGIEVCPEWCDSFEAFRDWAIANGYRDDLSLDRKNNDGNYCPENCRWATRREQQSNRNNTLLLTHDGETHTLAEWSEITGIKYCTLRYRVAQGFTGEKLFSTTKRKENPHAR